METNKPPRDLAKVIIVIKDLIPLVETDLIKDINKLIDNLQFQALEVRKGPDYWSVLADILNKHIPNIVEDWQIKIQDIVCYNY